MKLIEEQLLNHSIENMKEYKKKLKQLQTRKKVFIIKHLSNKV